MILATLLACGQDVPTPPHAGEAVGDDPGADGTGTVETYRRVLDPALPAPSEVTARVDVIVVGAGPAGLAAAAEAYEAGASILVLEREPTWGGAAVWAGGNMLFSGTPLQAEAGIEDSPAQLLEEWPAFTGGDTTDPWVRAFAESNVAMVYDWLAARGLTWDEPNVDPSAGITARVHTVDGGGSALVEAIGAGVPVGDVRWEAQMDDLLRRRDGRVAGVVFTDLATGEARTALADAVVVATGGFMYDLARVREVRPELAGVDVRHASWPGADGNGLALLEASGAQTQNLGAVGLYAHGTPVPGESTDEMLVPFVGGVAWVNANGARFVDESAVNSFQTGWTRAVQPDGLAWMIFDDETARDVTFTEAADPDATWDLAALEAVGHAVVADDLAGLAAALEVDPDTVADEVAVFNAWARGEGPDPFRAADGAVAPPIDAPPFHALPLAVAAAKGFGGVEVDLTGRVLDTDGTPIEGLYAAGELTGMAGGSLVGDYGFTGSLTAVVLSGRVAGASAAAEGAR